MKKILVVDDQKPILRNLNYILRNLGEVKTACNGQEGLDSARSFEPDLIILDMHMPGMDGYEVAETLRKEEFTNTIVAFTASVQKTAIDKCMTAGCNYYISKPFEPKELVGKIKEFLDTPDPASV